MSINEIDIQENYINALDENLLSILLKDRSSNKNIIWATDIYADRGYQYSAREQMTVSLITGRLGQVIRPRIDKSKKEQQIRIKDKAEVFTPSWICNEMTGFYDETFFDKKNVFNTPKDKTWTTNSKKIKFKDKTWQDYVLQKVLEITVGEAPFLCSRYDTVTGEWLNVNNRIGLLDKKLRVVGENITNEQEWYEWALKAYKSTYGYEWQGDSLLIARENLLFTFIDNFLDKFKVFPPKGNIIEIAEILSWNIWQMDGLKYVVPESCKPKKEQQISFFDNEIEECVACKKGNSCKHLGIYCKIKNWNTNRTIKFCNIKGDRKMKFDFIIGNPPYQETSSGDKLADDSVYHYFMDASFSVGEKVLLITPSKFLFNNGNTPKNWNLKMLNDEHFKVLKFEPKASNIFSNVSFKGGVAIHYRDANKNFGAILQFTEFDELNSLLRKVLDKKEESLTKIIYNQNKFDLEKLYKDFPKIKNFISSDGKEKRMTSGCLKYDCFSKDKQTTKDIQIIGVINNKREYRHINRKYVEEPNENLDKFKVIVPANNGSGAIGEVIATPLIGEPLIGEPLIGYTQTFIGIGAFETLLECSNALKYIKTKFARTMLGILKVTQNGKREMWKYVPLQDFSSNSDIDWTKSIEEIDIQLYAKYGLTKNEIDFIETHVKEMK